MKKNRRDRRFRPTLDSLSLRLAPSGGMVWLPPSPYMDPTGPRETPSVVVGANPDNYLEPVGPTMPC